MEKSEMNSTKKFAYIPRKEDLIEEIKSKDVGSTIPPRFYYYVGIRKIRNKEVFK